MPWYLGPSLRDLHVTENVKDGRQGSCCGMLILALRCLELCMFGPEVRNYRACRAVFKQFSWQQAFCAW